MQLRPTDPEGSQQEITDITTVKTNQRKLLERNFSEKFSNLKLNVLNPKLKLSKTDTEKHFEKKIIRRFTEDRYNTDTVARLVIVITFRQQQQQQG